MMYMPSKQNQLTNWYTRIPYRDRQAVGAVAVWLRPIRWQWFLTLTFPWSVRDETADQKLHAWFNALEHDLGTRICYVAGRERKPESYGIEVPWHFHSLVTAQTPIPKELLERHWNRVIRRTARGPSARVQTDIPALVEPYLDHEKGPEYCLKMMNDCNGDWQLRWLELFLPHQKQTPFPNSRSIRQQRRLLERSKLK
jgi:hypothetical protein